MDYVIFQNDGLIDSKIKEKLEENYDIKFVVPE